MSDLTRADLDDATAVTGKWWLFVITGILWILFAFVVLSFDLTTVWAVAVFAGFGFIGGGILELMTAAAAPSWKWLHVLFGIISIVAGVVALVWPGQTFLVLAAIVGWYLMLAGVLDIVGAFVAKGESDLWWLSLVVGVLQVLVGFWAVGYPGRSIVLLVVWVGASALARGISSLFMAFGLHKADGELRKLAGAAT